MEITHPSLPGTPGTPGSHLLSRYNVKCPVHTLQHLQTTDYTVTDLWVTPLDYEGQRCHKSSPSPTQQRLDPATHGGEGTEVAVVWVESLLAFALSSSILSL